MKTFRQLWLLLLAACMLLTLLPAGAAAETGEDHGAAPNSGGAGAAPRSAGLTRVDVAVLLPEYVPYRFEGSLSDLPLDCEALSDEEKSAVVTALANGWFDIEEGGFFGPERNVNRIDMAIILADHILKLDIGRYGEMECPFEDVFPWAWGYVTALYANGILEEVPADSAFRPMDPISEAEFRAWMEAAGLMVVHPAQGLVLGKDAADLQRDIWVWTDEEGSTISVRGRSSCIFGWESFPGDGKSGNYVALKLKRPAWADRIETDGNGVLTEDGLYVTRLEDGDVFRKLVVSGPGSDAAEERVSKAYNLDLSAVQCLPVKISGIKRADGGGSSLGYDCVTLACAADSTVVLSGTVYVSKRLADARYELGVDLTTDIGETVRTGIWVSQGEGGVLASSELPIRIDAGGLTVKVIETDARPSVGSNVVRQAELPDTLSETDRAAANEMRAAISSSGGVVVDRSVMQAAAAETAAGETVRKEEALRAVELPQVDDNAALTAIKQAAEGQDAGQVELVVLTYMDVAVTNAAADGASRSVTIDITPMKQTALAAKGSGEIRLYSRESGNWTDANAVSVGGPEPVGIDAPAEVKLNLPAGFAEDGEMIIGHVKQARDRTYFYTGAVQNHVLTFTSQHGFSEFTLYAGEDPRAAMIGEVGYRTLQAAVNDAANGQTIRLMKDCSERVTVSRAVSFTLDAGGSRFSGSIESGAGWKNSGSGSRYQFERDAGSLPGQSQTPGRPDVSVPSGDAGRDSDYDSGPSYPIDLPAQILGGTVRLSTSGAGENQRVTLTVRAEWGYELNKLSVTDSRGNELELTGRGDGQYTFRMPGSRVSVDAVFTRIASAASASPVFSDVQPGVYYYDAVQWAADNGIASGTGGGVFAPDAPCTRAQIVTLLWRAAGSPAAEGALSFADVPTGAYYRAAVQWAAEKGITAGTSAESFSPDAVCTRAQAVVFLFRAGGWQGGNESSGFADVSDSAYYAEAVRWAAASGVAAGTGAAAFSPDAGCTRGQIVTFLHRAYTG